MKKRIMNKLRSQTGASISFALLLFLVCAVLCSVILTAATAASGRMSNLAETDQRYYAVTSAAELLKDLFNKKTVKIEKITTGKREETYKNGSVSSSTTYGNDYSLKLNSEVVNDSSPSFSSIVTDAAYKYFKGKESENESGNFSPQSPYSLKIEPDIDGNTDSLAVDIKEVIDSNGNITLTVGDQFKIELVFSASVTGPMTNEAAGTSTTEIISDNKYTIETEMTKTETTTLTWTLTGIKTYPQE